jgi:hypothetical protein
LLESGSGGKEGKGNGRNGGNGGNEHNGGITILTLLDELLFPASAILLRFGSEELSLLLLLLSDASFAEEDEDEEEKLGAIMEELDELLALYA